MKMQKFLNQLSGPTFGREWQKGGGSALIDEKDKLTGTGEKRLEGSILAREKLKWKIKLIG